MCYVLPSMASTDFLANIYIFKVILETNLSNYFNEGPLLELCPESELNPFGIPRTKQASALMLPLV